ncbi:transposase domain-containing protein [Brucella intermedia]|uniref:transposase domain-containing protein n=1 Tax=Brucella intermedia TaxID=94625 RepID=UPI001AEEAA4F|nr:transposase domain-containing protein [Brucella intermedia]MBM7324929.1 transposase domain-containing protein [Agrobacterium sp. S2]
MGRIASLIETSKINGVEPFAYLKATLTARISNSIPSLPIHCAISLRSTLAALVDLCLIAAMPVSICKRILHPTCQI